MLRGFPRGLPPLPIPSELPSPDVIATLVASFVGRTGPDRAEATLGRAIAAVEDRFGDDATEKAFAFAHDRADGTRYEPLLDLADHYVSAHPDWMLG